MPRIRIRKPVFPAGLGLCDYAVPYVLSDKYTYAPRLSLSLSERSGHFPVMDEPAELDNSLFAFLGEG